MNFKLILNLFKFCISFCFLGLCTYLIAQETPPFEYYGTQEYRAAAQNWNITHNSNGEVFFANNEGVVYYDGSNWQTLKSINQSIVRSVYYADKRLYVGMYMEFGYFLKDNLGKWDYISLSESCRNDVKEDEQFWKIVPLGDQIVFQSLDQLFVFDKVKNTFSILGHTTGIIGSWVSDGQLYVQDQLKDLYQIVGGEWRLVAKSNQIGNSVVVSLKTKEEKLSFVNELGNIWEFQSGLWKSQIKLDISGARVFSAAALNNDMWALGTISDGLSIYDSQGTKKYQLSSIKGIKSNTVLSIHQDNQSNIWLGLDNGIICINDEAPIKTFVDPQGELGTIYTSAQINGLTYLGTNIGLFYRDTNMSHYSLVPESFGQVWELSIHNGVLLMGHHQGSFIVNGSVLVPLSVGTGAWTFKEAGSNLLLIGTYKGLELLEWKKNNWEWIDYLKGFNLSARYLESSGQTSFIVSHEYKGVYQLDLAENYRSVLSTKKFEVPEKGAHSALAKFDGSVWYNAPSGLWKYDYTSKKFDLQTWAPEIIGSDPYYSGKMVAIQNKSLWFFKRGKVIKLTNALTKESYKAQTFSISMDLLKPMMGFENVSKISQDKYLLGGVNQYLVLESNTINNPKFKPLIQKISGVDQKVDQEVILSISEEGKVPYKFNTLRFKIGSPDYSVYSESFLQYRLLGHQDQWSEWTDLTEIYWPRLSPGKYRFEIRSGNSIYETSNVVSYAFEIIPPWYLHPLMWVTYLFGSLSFIWITHRSDLRYFKRQKQRILDESLRRSQLNELQVEQKFIKEKNSFLENEFRQKKKELANTLLHLNKNFDLLSEVKDQLTRSSNSHYFDPLIDRIDESLNEGDSWHLLEEAFNNIDNEFLSKLKNEFSDLSPSELKMCVYLRLNLSTKEIATLLNIAPKSVEIKRYRLRKKLRLDQEEQLQEYILRY